MEPIPTPTPAPTPTPTPTPAPTPVPPEPAWTLLDGVLTFYTEAGIAEWILAREDVTDPVSAQTPTRIVVQAGVKRIPDNAFGDMASLTDVPALPD